MPDQVPLTTQPQPNTKPVDTPQRAPKIRTMKSDMDELLKSTKSSFIQIASQQIKAVGGVESQQKISYRFIFGLFVVLLLIGGVGLGAYLSFFTESAPLQISKLAPPAPLFATETSRTIATDAKDTKIFLRLMDDSSKELEREGTMKRILIKVKNSSNERFSSLADFFSLYGITPPDYVVQDPSSQFMTFFYYTAQNSRFGFAAKVRDSDRILRSMLEWEPTLFVDAKPLFFGTKPNGIFTNFEDRTYRNIDWRFLKLSQTEDLGLGYAVFPVGNILIFATSKTEMENIINRLFDAR